jgi:hypothetical protein
MKHINKILSFLSVGLALVVLPSCNKWLDVQPKSQVAEETLFSTPQGFKDALFGAYGLMTSSQLYGGEMTMGIMSAVGQDYDLSNPSHNYYSAGLYNYTNLQLQSSINSIWSGSYTILANINNLLGHIDAQRSSFNANEYNMIKGEALGLRAYIHFDMLRMFAPSYLDGKDVLAIPYVTDYSKTVTKFSTVSEVVALALKDLQDAEVLLANDPVKNGNATPQSSTDLLYRRECHFNKFAINGLQARIYLYMANKPKALEAALKVIGTTQFRFIMQSEITPTGGARNRTFTPEQIFSLFVVNLPATGSFQDLHFHATSPAGYSRLTNTLSNYKLMFEVSNGGSTDYRYVYLLETESGILLPSKFWQPTDAPDALKSLVPLVRLSEMYYIAAECTPNVSDGIDYLNRVRINRGLSLLPKTLSSDDLLKEILKEYRKEFNTEGQTFFQYKRLNWPAISGTVQPGNRATYVMPIPANELQYRNN